MANKGLQFENCIMYLSRSIGYLGERDYTTKLAEFQDQYNSSPQEVKDAARNAIDGIFSELNCTTTDQKKTLCKTFDKRSGGVEPKTDILFKKNGKKYKCSLKYGDSFQLSSAGIEKSNEFLTKVIKKVAKDMGQRSLPAVGQMVMILEQIDGVIGDEKGKQTATTVQSKLSNMQGIQYALQQILGSRTQPNVGEAYIDFKKTAVRECLTGELTFGATSDDTANYILEGPTFALHKIDDAYVDNIVSKSSVRIAAKGRGKVEGAGGEIVRYQEATIRFDVKS
jgi:hypothetical protein